MSFPVYRDHPALRPHRRKRSPGPRLPLSFALALLSGVALGLSFPPYPFPALAWVALVPLLLNWTRRTEVGWMLVDAYVGFGVACMLAFYWVLQHDVPEAALASLGGLLLFPLLMALPFAASLPLRRRWGSVAGFVALVAFYLTLEWGLSRGPLAFPWPLLGHTQATFDPIRQMADLAGVPGLTAWLLALNGLALVVLRSNRLFVRGAAALAGLLLILGAHSYGTHRLATPPPAAATTEALLVQPALPPAAWADVTDSARVDTLLRLSTAALDTTARDTATAPVDLVIWPETALPAFADTARQQALFDRLQRWTREHEVTLLTGAVETASGRARGVYFNSALFFRPHTLQRYRKRYLVPFAEHVPFSASLPVLRTLAVPAGGVAGYRRGTHRPTLHGPDHRVGALICFESTFSHHVRAYIDPRHNTQPVDFLVTVAQDGWWGRSPGYRQHLAFSQLRAIEVRRAMAFVTVTGTTALIDPHGRPHASTDWMERGTRRVTIPHATGQSLYVRMGDWLSLLALGFAAGFILFAFGQGFGQGYLQRRNNS